MKVIVQKIKANDLALAIFAIGIVLIPIFLKLALSGHIGPTFNFYFFIYWIPISLIGVATLRGWKTAALTAFLFMGAFLIAFVSYPQNPLMDFRRQFVFQANYNVVIAAILSLVLQVYLRPRGSNNSSPNGAPG